MEPPPSTPSLPPGTTPPAPRRRRGAQPGNANALKHGFYARALKSSALGGVKDLEFDGLTQEIDVLRLVIRRLIERYGEIGDLDQEMRFTMTLSHALAQLSRMVRIQFLIAPQHDEVLESIQRAIARTVEEQGLY